MTARFTRRAVGAALAFTLAAVEARALADVPKTVCIEANTKAQSLRSAGKFAASRAQLLTCSDPSCPELVRIDCTTRMDELEAAQPSIVFDAKDPSGRDLSQVQITVDGHPLVDNLDGTALRVDPGEHSFTFTLREHAEVNAPVTQSFVIREGERERHERVVIGSGPASVPSAALVDSPSSASSPSSEAPGSGPSGARTAKIVALALGGVGVAGIAIGSVFGLLDFSESSKQKSACQSATNCPHFSDAASAHSSALTDGNVSTIAFVAGGALLAGGVVLFLTAGRSSHPPASTGLVLAPDAGPGRGGFLLSGRFW